MNIQVNYEVASTIMNIIEKDLYKEWTTFESEIDKVESSEGIKLMIDFYNSFDFSTYKTILFHALNELGYETEDGFLRALYEHLKRIIALKEKLSEKLKLIKTYDYESLREKLANRLPKGTELDIEIFFVLDGINGGSIVGDNKMMLNTMFWPSSLEKMELIEGILLHEYHHLGLLHWIKKNNERFDNHLNGKDVAKYLMIAIMSEGAATYFYNYGDDIYPLIVESHGEEVASAYRDSMLDRGDNLVKYIGELEADLNYLMEFDGKIDELKTLKSKYTYNDTGEPLDKSIGYHMCSVIETNLGTQELIECFENPDMFLQRYHEACDIDGELRFNNDFVNKWIEFTS